MQEDFAEILEKIKADEALLQAKQSELTVKNPEMCFSESDLRGLIAEFSGYVMTRNIPECKKFIQQFVEKVTVYDTKVEVTLRVASLFMSGEEYTFTKSMGRSFLKQPESTV